MKLRVKNNSVRLRLTPGDVARFNDSGRVEEAIEFGIEPHQRFVYALETGLETERMRATIENNRITIFVPKTQADEWTNTARVEMESEQDTGGVSLRLLIEKDFACLEPRAGEEDENTYPHPLEGKVC
ncbi:MAG: hypothetical protein LH614_21665 [Pyrinomonadaceae bacterium]|nr:hypothetical protein [Pyrinomonadaceae bacterium]